MKEIEKRMEAQTNVFGKMIKRYSIPLSAIDDLNKKYEQRKENLESFGWRLAGRMESELKFTDFIAETEVSKYIVDCMNDYIETLEKVNLFGGNKELEILNCWINDMKEEEYNPPHTHHDNTGYSSVMFLKVPEFINDVKDPHKFKDGQLGFTDVNGSNCTWFEPEVGHFYIFDASHQHFVMPFKVKNKGEIRRSMSFNFIQKIV